MPNDDGTPPSGHGVAPTSGPLNTSTSIGGPAELESELHQTTSPDSNHVVRHEYDATALSRVSTSDDTLPNISSPTIGSHTSANRDDHVAKEEHHQVHIDDDAADPPSTPQRNPLSRVHSERRRSQEIITFHSTSPQHPHNWPTRRKALVFATGIASVINSTLGSSLPSNAVPTITTHFAVTDSNQFPLPISCFLMGYVIGPILCGPLSESYGRKPPMVFGFLLYILFTGLCAASPSWPVLLVFRLLCGVSASAPIAIVGGLYADVYASPHERGLAMAYFMVATTLGPVMAPVVSGFVVASGTSWRWVFGAGALFAVLTLPILIIMPESYVPVLLRREAAKLRKETGRTDIVAQSEIDGRTWSYILTNVMTRPFRMLIHEAIVSCTCLYLALVYSIFYLYFQSYPLIFLGPSSVYNFTPGLAGLPFLAIFVGSLIGLPIFLWWDRYLARKQEEGAKWAKQEEYRRLPLACLGGPLFVCSIFWLGWSATPDTHWIVPTLSGVPFGVGFLLIFMALLNYLSDAYLTFAASAQGMASTCRSLGGAVLPIAGRKMFLNLGIDWACTLLAFLALGVAVIPFVFIRYGDRIRANSKFCQELKRLMEEEREEERKEDERKRSRGVAAGNGEGRGGDRGQEEKGGRAGTGEV